MAKNNAMKDQMKSMFDLSSQEKSSNISAREAVEQIKKADVISEEISPEPKVLVPEKSKDIKVEEKSKEEIKVETFIKTYNLTEITIDQMDEMIYLIKKRVDRKHRSKVCFNKMIAIAIDYIAKDFENKEEKSIIMKKILN